MAQKIDLSCWQDFEKEIEKIAVNHQTDKRLIRRLLYRGQSDANWRLQTTLERHLKTELSLADYLRTIASLQSEIETFTQNRWDVPEYTELSNSFSNYELFHNSPVLYKIYGYMAHLRHHGFPSPLLDWTRSARVAAYFAFAGAEHSERVSIYVLSEARMHTGGGKEPEIRSLGPNVKTHRRHFLQQCEYTMCARFENSQWWFADHDAAFESRNESEDPPINFANYHFTFPGSERLKVLEMLDRDNVNAFSLFGSEESLMETLALREFHFPNPYFGNQ